MLAEHASCERLNERAPDGTVRCARLKFTGTAPREASRTPSSRSRGVAFFRILMGNLSALARLIRRVDLLPFSKTDLDALAAARRSLARSRARAHFDAASAVQQRLDQEDLLARKRVAQEHGRRLQPARGARTARRGSRSGRQAAGRRPATRPPTSRSSRASRRFASVPACTSARPASVACTTSSTRSSTTRSTRRSRATATRSRSCCTRTTASPSPTTAAASRSTCTRRSSAPPPRSC